MRVVALHWGVKESFRTYVEAVGGVITVAGGAERTPDGAFTFPAEGGLAVSEGRLEGLARFAGEVRFEAHGGILSVRLADLALESDGAKASLTVAGDRASRLELALLDLPAMNEANGDCVVPAALAIDGSFLLGDHYLPRTALDAVRLKLAGG